MSLEFVRRVRLIRTTAADALAHPRHATSLHRGFGAACDSASSGPAKRSLPESQGLTLFDLRPPPAEELLPIS